MEGIPGLASASSQSQPPQVTKTPAQKKLDQARARLKLEHAEATRAVVDPSGAKPPRLTARQRAKYPKLTATDDILTAIAADRWASLTSSDQYLLQPDRPEEPFYAQLEEIRRWDLPPSRKGGRNTKLLRAQQPAVQYSLQASSDNPVRSGRGHSLNNTFGGPLTFGGIGNHLHGNTNSHRGRGKSTGGHTNQQRPQPKDRTKLKYDIPGCEPWVLVKTKLGRRFVYNTETDKSFWRIPPDVLKGVTEFDRQEREKRIRQQRSEIGDGEHEELAVAEAELATAADGSPTATPAPGPSLGTNQETAQPTLDSDGEEYEEVEVTDDEEEGKPSKRQKTSEENVEQPVEFDEDDIAFQLAAMGQEYGLDPGEYGDGDGEELEDGAEGLALTEEDATALFKDMLSDQGISPYATWDKVIETGYIVEDERYTVLPNMRSRKEVWGAWTRDTIAHLKAQREKEEKKDPKIPYFAFLQKNATPKLYWPEFRRKYRKEPEMYNNKLSDKDREKWYRDYISRLKLPEATVKSDLVNLLQSTPLYALNKSIKIHALPTTLLTDLRYISLRPAIRDPLIEVHISTLPPAPTDLEISPEEQETQAKERQERQRRQEALAERQRQVQEEKKRQNGALRYSKGVLREGEEEVQRAMRVGKEGLLGHIAKED
ncbi:MAG: hypothetical protein ASARMPREDX12_000239 [Alectoria sarmentosa]|nr:MAG: hypothetical protein ASARMPREDX12_000239 [Alectoria sarmentosa]